MLMVGQYFKRKRDFVETLLVSASGIGILVMSIFMEYALRLIFLSLFASKMSQSYFFPVSNHVLKWMRKSIMFILYLFVCFYFIVMRCWGLMDLCC